MRVCRLLIYEGTEKWVKATLEYSKMKNGNNKVADNFSIKVITLGTIPDDIEIIFKEVGQWYKVIRQPGE